MTDPADRPDRPGEARLLLAVRADDLDVNGHVRGPAYLAYADHARWALVASAGVDLAGLAARRLGPVNLETTLRFHAELRPGDEVEVRTRFVWGTSGSAKISEVHQHLHRGDGTLAAEVRSVSGLLDLDTRRLRPHPESLWRELAADPARLGLVDPAGTGPAGGPAEAG